MDEKRKKQILWAMMHRIVIALILLIAIMYLVLNARKENTQKTVYEELLQKFEASQNEIIMYNRRMAKKYGLSSKGYIPASVTINAKKTNSESIGNEIIHLYKINGVSVFDGDVVQFRLFNTNTFFSEIRESDPSNDDVGNSVDERLCTISDLNDGIVIKQNISVHESHGKRAGNTATYTVTYRAVLNKKIPLSSQDLREEPKKQTRPELKNISITRGQVLKQDGYSRYIAVALIIVLSLWIIGKYTRETATAREDYRLEQKKKQQFAAEKAAFIKKVAGKTIRELANVPCNIVFNERNLPIDNNDARYGSFTVYRSKSGACFHRKKGCCSAHYETHAFIAKSSRLNPCTKCCREGISIPPWYQEYLNLKQEYIKYGIAENGKD
ncbi:MAG: hypothetical protein IKC04_00625 [Oscillospiraceae bacterium]|nr:hypothetical protein [Oscillospiraceae bacterium]